MTVNFSMRVKNWFAASLLSAGLCALALPALAQQQQQQSSSGQQQTGDPVADAARKAREQQKTAPKPKKIYTDDDVKPATPSDNAAANSQPAEGAQPGAENGQGAAAGASGKNDPETVWRKRFADQRDKIAAAEKELDVLQRELEKAQIQYYPDPQKALQQQYTRQDINDKNAKIDQKKQQIADLKQQLSDMEDELRKSGGDPGWAR
jgi:DNA repair exonuclease SbcCD ATPase subunit